MAIAEGFDTLVSEYCEGQEQPFFAYDLDSLGKHIASLQQDDITLWYAVKANPLSAVIRTLADNGMRFDVASRGELSQVLAQGISPEKILNTGPAKSAAQLKTFLDEGITTFVVESIEQLKCLNEQALKVQRESTNVRPRVLLRVQLRWDDEEHNPLGGNALTPFGLGPDEWSQICLSDYPALSVEGLHIFQWGNILSVSRLAELWRSMIAPLTALAERLRMPLKVLDLGGGLGIPYDPSEPRLEWSDVHETLRAVKAEAGVEELWLELGRYAVGECGVYVAPVVDRKTSYGKELLVLEGGINHLLRPAITDQPFPARLLRQNAVTEQQSFAVHGPLCTSLDQLGQFTLPADTRIGDWLHFSQCGAYGFTESMPFFLCHAIAAEVVVEGGELRVVREAQPADWYLR